MLRSWAKAALRNVCSTPRGFDLFKQSYPPRPIARLCGYFGILQPRKFYAPTAILRYFLAQRPIFGSRGSVRYHVFVFGVFHPVLA